MIGAELGLEPGGQPPPAQRGQSGQLPPAQQRAKVPGKGGACLYNKSYSCSHVLIHLICPPLSIVILGWGENSSHIRL